MRLYYYNTGSFGFVAQEGVPLKPNRFHVICVRYGRRSQCIYYYCYYSTAHAELGWCHCNIDSRIPAFRHFYTVFRRLCWLAQSPKKKKKIEPGLPPFPNKFINLHLYMHNADTSLLHKRNYLVQKNE